MTTILDTKLYSNNYPGEVADEVSRANYFDVIKTYLLIFNRKSIPNSSLAIYILWLKFVQLSIKGYRI